MDWKNLVQRVAVAVVFAPLILYTSWRGGLGYLVLVELIVIIGLVEFYRLAQHKGLRPNYPVGVLAGAVVAPILYWRAPGDLWIVLAAMVVLLLATELFRAPHAGQGPMLNAAATMLGVLYVPGLLSFLLLIRELPRVASLDYATAGSWVVMLFLTIWICDTAAYFVGMRFGRRKLFARVSPKKTVAGAVGGVIFGVLTALACHALFVQGLRVIDAAVIGLLAGTAGQISDLVESLFKRDAGVKDSSGLIPGHGGMLDRFDSEMLVAPLVYFYLAAVVA